MRIHNAQTNPILGTSAAAFVVLLWSGWIVVSRSGVTHHLTVYDLTGLRFGIGASVALPYILWRRAWRGLTPLRVSVLTLTCGVPYALLGYFGFTYAPAAHGGIFMNGCLPLFTTLTGWIWLGQRSRASQAAGLGVILIGVALVGYEGMVSPGGGMIRFGDLLFLSAIPILHEMPGLPAWIGMGMVTIGILLALGIVGPAKRSGAAEEQL